VTDTQTYRHTDHNMVISTATADTAEIFSNATGNGQDNIEYYE